MAAAPTSEEVRAFLGEYHGCSVTHLELLRGHWSVAYAYVADDRELVLRFGQMREGLEMDRLATTAGSWKTWALRRPHELRLPWSAP